MSPEKIKVNLKRLSILAAFYSALFLSEPLFNINVASATIEAPGEPEEVRHKHSELQVAKTDRYTTCGSKLIILNCDYSEPRLFSRSNVNKISFRYDPEPICNIKTISSDWVLIYGNKTAQNLQDFHNMDTFVIEPYSLKSGYYQIVLYLKEYYENGTENMLSEQCIFKIGVELSIPILAASKITVNNGQNLTIDGRGSIIGPNIPTVHNKSQLYNFTETIQTECCDENLDNDTLSTVPMVYALDGLANNFKLSFKTEEPNWQSSSQFIQLRNEENEPTFHWFCLKNCPPLVPICDVEQEIILGSECNKNCEEFQSLNLQYYWTIDAPGFDYDRDTEFGQVTDIFHINANVLQPNMVYNFTVNINVSASSHEGEGQIETHARPKLSSCQIQPESGYALKTKFYVTCDVRPGNYTFKLYSVTDKSEFLLVTGNPLDTLAVTLDENTHQVKVKIIDQYQFSDFQILNVTVHPALLTVNPDDLAKEIQEKYFDPSVNNSITNLLKGNKSDELLQVLNVLIEEISGVPENKDTVVTIKEYQKKVLDILKNLSPVSKEMAKQIVSVSSKIAAQYEPKSDPDMAELITDVCEDASSKFLGYVQKERYPNMLADEISRATKLFSGCSRATSGPNFEILETEDNVDVPTTPFPLVDFPMIPEDYPDYVDDQNLSKVLTKYETSSNKLINQCYMNSKAIALSLMAYDDTSTVGTDYFQITATKKHGSDIPYVTISSQDVNVSASEDFIQYDDKDVNVLMCTITKNPLWWIGGEKVTTTIAMLAFDIDGKVVSNFVKPFSISFKNNENNFSSIIVHTAATPRQQIIFVNQETVDFEKITMFRIDVFRQQSYVIEFQDLAPSDNLYVYVSDFIKPTPKEFRDKSVKINQNNSKLFIPHENDYDSWHYLCVLPDETMGTVTSTFKFRVYTMACFRWQATVRNWEFSCGAAATSTLEHFDCLCHQSSVLCGRLRKNNVREEKSNLFIIHELELQANYVIFISVAVAFFLYCVLLIYITISSKKNSGRSIYFLSDIPSSYLFGYILIVKTGNGSNAGTTSNVVIKLYGESSKSKEHVLNFPDPEKRILQRNQEDWFFLATEHYLGEIEKLEIWFDSLGFRPSWYCSEIEVIDLQMNKYWWFNIKFRFEICEKENYFFTAVPETRTKRVDKKKFSLKKLSIHGCHMWNIFRDEEIAFSRAQRLTIMLSILMTTYTVILFFYGCPKLQDSDSLGQYSEYGFHAELVWVPICGFTLTFLVHSPIVYFFRYYQKDKNAVNKKRRFEKYTHQIHLICWCLLVFLIIATMTTLLILGFWVQHITALLWLTSTGTSLLIYVFVLENGVKLVHNFTMKRTNRVFYILSRMKPTLAYIEAQRAYLFKYFGQVGLRPHFKHLYKPLGTSRIKEQKHWARIKQNTLEILEDLVMITIYVILLYTVILKDKDPMTRLSNQEVKDLVVGIHSRTKPKKHPISNRKEIQDYIVNTTIFSMQSLQWYGKFVSEDPGMTIDNSNKYIGVARLRQLRSNNISCTVVSPMEFLWKECIHGFSDGPEYGDFSEEWKNDVMSDSFARMDSLWNYKGYHITGSFSYVGKFATYPGGGYVATLGRTMKNSLINTDYIFRNNWFDKFTRCLFIEFLLYNSNSNLFQSVLVKFEMSTTGFVRPIFNVNSARLLFVKEKAGVLLWIVMASFVFMVLILIVKLLLKIARKKKMVFRDLWHIVDIIIITISMACLFLYMERTLLVKSFLDRIENAKHNEFVNYTQLFFAETSLTSLAALLVFLATLRLWKLLKFLLIIKIAEKTLALSVAPLACTLLHHMLTIFLFTLVGLIFFGDQSFDFKDIVDSIMTLVLLSLCLYEKFDFGALKTPLHYLYYSLYMIISLYFLTVYVAIVTICYGEAQICYSNEEGYGVFDYLKEQYRYYRGVAKIKLKHFRRRRGGEDGIFDEGKPVVPKADEFRYAKCLSMSKNKTNAMLYATLGILRSMKGTHRRLTNDDEDLIKLIIVNFFRSDTEENDYFYIGNFHSQKAKLVDDLVLQKMEKVLTILLSKTNERKEQLYEGLLENNTKNIERMSKNLSIVLNTLSRIEVRVEE